MLASPPLNLFDRALIDGVIAAVGEAAADPPRALLVRAEGKVVSGGVNVELFDGLDPEAAGALWTELLAEIVEPLEALDAPVVFAAHGLTLTAAFEIALACDLIVAARSARFGLVETVVGLTPSMGGTQRLAERAGSGAGARARDDRRAVRRRAARALGRRQPGLRGRRLRTALARAGAEARGRTDARPRDDQARRAGATAPGESARPTTRSATDAGELFATEDLQGAVKTFLERGPGHATFRNR